MSSPRWSLRWAILAPVFGLLGFSFSQAATVVINPIADTTLYSGDPTNNLGALSTLIAGTTASGQSNRAVLRFDIATAVPPQAILQAVSLSLTVTRTTALGTNEFRLHRLQKSWGEGAGAGSNTGSPASAEEATWMSRYHPKTEWAVAGGGAGEDYLATPSAAQSIAREATYTFSDPGLVEDVDHWRTNASANAGWILVCADEGVIPTSRRIASREDPLTPPQLTIRYEVPGRLHLELPAVADTSLFEYRADNNLGATELASGSIGFFTNRSRALMRFDLSGLPPEALLTWAQLRLVVTRVSGGGAEGTGTNFMLHRLLQPWGEGSGGGGGELLGTLAQPGEATWFMRFFPDLPWSQPGSGAGEDFLATPSSTQFIDSFGPYRFTTLEEDLQFWREHPDQNFGWILINAAEDVPRTARRFAAREDPFNGPVLELDYLTPPRIDDIRLGAGSVEFQFQVLAFNHYVMECTPVLNPSTWTACSSTLFPVATGPVTLSVPRPEAPRFYRLRLEP